MTRMTKLLTALLVLGCGSGAMANTGYRCWTSAQAQPQAGPPALTMDEDRGQPGQNAPPEAQRCCPEEGSSQAEAQGQDQDQDMAETHAWETGQSHLGVLVMGMTPELRRHLGAPNDSGVLIARIEPDSAASRAGIQVGDVLLRVGGRQIRSGTDVIEALAAHGGGRVALSVIRQGRVVRIDAMIPGPRQQQPEPPPEHPI